MTKPAAFWTTPVEAAARRLASLIRLYGPQAIATYDEYGFCGHPDHIEAHRITMAAVDRLGPDEAPAKIYWTTMPPRPMRGLRADRTATVIIAGLAFLQDLRGRHYEIATETAGPLRVAAAFTELAGAI